MLPPPAVAAAEPGTVPGYSAMPPQPPQPPVSAAAAETTPAASLPTGTPSPRASATPLAIVLIIGLGALAFIAVFVVGRRTAPVELAIVGAFSAIVVLFGLSFRAEFRKSRDNSRFSNQLRQGFTTTLPPEAAQSLVVGQLATVRALVTAMNPGLVTGTSNRKKETSAIEVLLLIVLILICIVFLFLYLVDQNRSSAADPFTIQFVPEGTGTRIVVTGSNDALRVIGPAFVGLPGTALVPPKKW